MSKKYIASVLKRLRLKSGLTADEVGLMVGKSGKTVNGWENARSQPDAEILLKLCDIYEVEDIMAEFSELKEITTKEQLLLTAHEKSVIIAYRQHPSLQEAVDRLLGVSNNEMIAVPIAARSSVNRPVEIAYISKEQLEKLNESNSVEDEVDL